MFTIRVRGRMPTEKVNAEIETGLRSLGEAALRDLQLATPVDTGRARAGWQLSFLSDQVVLNNPVPYIGALNAGHSTQAPSHFIEATVLNYGRPVGPVVAYEGA